MQSVLHQLHVPAPCQVVLVINIIINWQTSLVLHSSRVPGAMQMPPIKKLILDSFPPNSPVIYVPRSRYHCIHTIIGRHEIRSLRRIAVNCMHESSCGAGTQTRRPVQVVGPSGNWFFVRWQNCNFNSNASIHRTLRIKIERIAPIGGRKMPAGKKCAWWLTRFSEHRFVIV